MGANVAYSRFQYEIVFESNRNVQIACIRKHRSLDRDKWAESDLQK